MANEEHLAILRQGVAAWNRWRENNPDVQPDLRWADLSGVNLEGTNRKGANLEEVTLFETNLFEADLRWANLRGADLRGVNLQGAYLERTNFSHAYLLQTDFQRADLFDANLEGANIFDATFGNTSLFGCQFDKAYVSRTIFADVDLRGAQGLSTVQHGGPSTIGIDTLYKSHGQIPEVFLRGCGVPDSMIEYARSLVAAERPIDYYSCFISYSSKDEALAERLYADLQARGVRCWYAPHDMQIGEPILSGIDRGIRLHDKLLLVLSEASVESGWVEQEVHMALAREKTERRRVLFPIRIDDAAIESRQGWPAVLRDTIHIGDFKQWKQHDAYQAAFARLLRNLKTERA